MHNKKSVKCRAALQSANIDVSLDDSELHPESVCNSCYLGLNQMGGSEGISKDIDIVVWSAHTDPCTLCSTARAESLGGRPRKRARLIEGENNTINSSFLRAVNNCMPPSPPPAWGL